MSDENPDDLIVLKGPGWQKLPDGSYQLPVQCETIVHYVTLPKTLRMGKWDLVKSGWDSERKLAYYRDRQPDLTDGTAEGAL